LNIIIVSNNEANERQMTKQVSVNAHVDTYSECIVKQRISNDIINAMR